MSKKAIFYVTGPRASGKTTIANRMSSSQEYERGLYPNYKALRDHMLPQLLSIDNAIITERDFDWTLHDKLKALAKENQLLFITFTLE